MLIILVRYQLVANAADAPLSGAPQGGAAQTGKRVYSEHHNTINSTYCMKCHIKPSRIQECFLRKECGRLPGHVMMADRVLKK